MPRTSSVPKPETFTFRLDPALKAGLTRAAAEAAVPPAELLRALVRDHLDARATHAFEAEARRQSASIAARARDPASDETRVMAEIAENADAFGADWKA